MYVLTKLYKNPLLVSPIMCG